MNKMNLKYGLIALVALGISANVNARDITCDDVTFNEQAFTGYEYIDQACQEVVNYNGVLYAKFVAMVEQQAPTGTRIKFLHSDGTWGKEHLARNRLWVANIEDKDIRILDLPLHQEANVYLPSEAFTVKAAPVERVAEERVVEEKAVEEEYVAPPPPPAPVKEKAPVVLPTTAGPLPWLALFGGVFLLLGGALRLSRKY